MTTNFRYSSEAIKRPGTSSCIAMLFVEGDGHDFYEPVKTVEVLNGIPLNLCS
jgi:hypothetical protein